MVCFLALGIAACASDSSETELTRPSTHSVDSGSGADLEFGEAEIDAFVSLLPPEIAGLPFEELLSLGSGICTNSAYLSVEEVENAAHADLVRYLGEVDLATVQMTLEAATADASLCPGALDGLRERGTSPGRPSANSDERMVECFESASERVEGKEDMWTLAQQYFEECMAGRGG
jgi:hypothetical protein